MSYTVQQGGRIDYNYKETFIDLESELNTLSVESMCPGSVIYVIENGNIYILNQKREWIKQ